MSHTIAISDEVFSRLEKLAVGFDTPSNVIERLLDVWEKNNVKTIGNGSSPPCGSQFGAMLDRRLFTNKEVQRRISAVAQKLPVDELEKLCNLQISKELFGLSFPLFVRVSSKANQATKRAAVKSSDGVSRWTWKFEFENAGDAYAVCTQWYPKNDEYVQKWLAAHE